MFAEVYIDTTNISLDRPFHYNIPQRLTGDVVTGVRVTVPFGAANRKTEAIIARLVAESGYDAVKDIISVKDKALGLSEKDIELIFYMREKYCCTFYQAARLMLPVGSSKKSEEWISLREVSDDDIKKAVSKSAAQERLCVMLKNSGGALPMSAIKSEMGKNARQSVTSLLKKGIIEKTEKDRREVGGKTVKTAYLAPDADCEELLEKLGRSSPAQARIIEFLKDGGEYTISDILSSAKCSRPSLDALCVRGLVCESDARIMRNPYAGKHIQKTEAFAPTAEQKNAIEKITAAKEGTILLHGVTGSGKTEVYLQAAEKIISEGKQAIVLVPEISLTPQITDRFYARFGSVVAVMHSALSLGERFDEFCRIKSGEAKVVVGARSAVFAPLKSLGLIIIDEEHEYSYKSETVPKYHAAEIAKERCAQFGCPLVLASATPSAESYYMAKTGEYELVELTERYNKNPLPKVEIADMRSELEAGNRTVLSRKLASELFENIKNREQTILFLNRRGFSTFVSCRSCGFVYMCPDCSVSLTYHSESDSLNCHICGYRRAREKNCPSCGSDRIKDFGTGTQKAQMQIEALFPDAKVVRMDIDTTGGRHGHEKILAEFENENADILLGTQMVSKGLDFPNVTLVGALAADSSLYANDFRAQERTFSLIAQVCGRAGRGEREGRAVIQTYSPENRVLRLAAAQDYKAFYNDEIEYRRVFGYPPFLHIVSVTVSAQDERDAAEIAEETASEIKISAPVRESGIRIFGPMDAPVKKMQGKYRKRIWFKCADAKAFTETFRAILARKRRRRALISIDIDPYGMN